MGALVVAGSENQQTFAVIDFTNLASPTKVLVNPGLGSGCRVAMDGCTLDSGVDPVDRPVWELGSPRRHLRPNILTTTHKIVSRYTVTNAPRGSVTRSVLILILFRRWIANFASYMTAA
jgi:hypothetical protein